MICSKCNRFNMSESKFCKYCGAELVSNPGSEKLRHFAGEDFKIDIDDIYLEDSSLKQTDNSEVGKEPVPVNIQRDSSEYEDVDIPFENEFAFSDTEFAQEPKRVMTNAEKTEFRNTALLAVILAVLIDTVLTVSMIIYFKGFAQKIVNVDKAAVVMKSEDIIKG